MVPICQPSGLFLQPISSEFCLNSYCKPGTPGQPSLSTENQPTEKQQASPCCCCCCCGGKLKVGKAGLGSAVPHRACCLGPPSWKELCEVWRSPKGGSWNANTKLNNELMSLAANQEGWCHTLGSPVPTEQEQQPLLASCPFLTDRNYWGSNLLKFIIWELSAHKTQFITPAVLEKFPKTIELCGSSHSSSLKHMMSRQIDFLTFFFTALAVPPSVCWVGDVLVCVFYFWCGWYTVLIYFVLYMRVLFFISKSQR